MVVPPVARTSGEVRPQLRPIGSRGALILLGAALLAGVSVLAALIPRGTLPLTWYVPVLDVAMVVTLAVVLFLCALDVIIRRHDRLLAIAFASTILGIVWLAHMLTFPGVIPARPAFI